MDALLSTLGVHALNFAIRSGIRLTSSYAVDQCSRLLKTVDDRALKSELRTLKRRLDNKIKIISPTIDLIEFKSARGNVFLESAVPLSKGLHRDIVDLGRRFEAAAIAEESSRRVDRTLQNAAILQEELRNIILDVKALLDRIDRDIPLLQLAITTSGETLSATLKPGISPSRLLQAGALINVGDVQYAHDPTRPVQIGPSFTLSLYMLFMGHVAKSQHSAAQTPAETEERPYGLGEGDRKPLWQEVIHKARVRLCRTPPNYLFDPIHGYRPINPTDFWCRSKFAPKGLQSDFFDRSNEYAYHLEIIEDLDDGRFHPDQEGRHDSYDNISHAGIRESIPLYQLSRIFYADIGRILNIGNTTESDNKPVLLLKRDPSATRPKKWTYGMTGRTDMDETPTETSDGHSCHGSEGPEGSTVSDSQEFIDRQIREESMDRAPPSVARDFIGGKESNTGRIGLFGGFGTSDLPSSSVFTFPSHLDPEWLALEAFEEDDDGDEGLDSDVSETSDDEGRDGIESRPRTPQLTASHQHTSIDGRQRGRYSHDSRFIEQVRTLSLQHHSSSPTGISAGSSNGFRSESQAPSTPATVEVQRSAARQEDDEVVESREKQESFMARSPFGTITSSLSLLEMLIRLTGLQEFQQTSHLTIPDHILTFFMEETSTTGLHGEEQWKVRNEVKQRVGFDPYTDTPTKQ